MADKEFEDDDPMELVGTVCEGDAAGGLDEMARTIVEEFVRMGWPSDQIMSLFVDPFYRGPHAVFQAKGMAYVMGLIEQVSTRR
jgi:hypothetical protein